MEEPIKPPQPITPEAWLRGGGGVLGVVATLAWLISTIRRILEDVQHIAFGNVVLALVVGAALLWSIHLVLDAFRIRSRFAQADNFVAALTSGGTLIGRAEDLRTLEQRITDCPEVHLIGQEGMGKTALLRKLESEIVTESRFIPFTISTWSGGFETGPIRRLTDDLWTFLTPEQRRKLHFSAPSNYEQLETVLRRFREVTGSKPLLILDQVEEYQLLYADEVFDVNGVQITRDELTRTNAFWRLLQRLASEEVLHLLVARSPGTLIPKLTSEACELVLYRVSSSAVASFFRGVGDEKVVADPQRGWTELYNAVVDELTVNSGVIPRHLVFVCSELARLPRLTMAEYEIAQRLPGLATRFVDREVKETADTRKLDINVLRAAVQTLISDAAPAHRTLNEIRQRIGTNDLDDSADSLNASLLDLEQRGVLRRRVDPQRREIVWSPTHSLIVEGIAKLEESQNRWHRLLEGRGSRHATAKNLWAWWWTLLPPSMQIGIVFQRLRGQVRYGQRTRYAVISMLRLLPYVATGLVLLFCIAAERGYPVPFGEPVDDFLYLHGIAITRRIPVESQLLSKASKGRGDLIKQLTARMHDHLFWPGRVPERENWVQAQALAALFRSPELSASDVKELQTALEVLFQPKEMIRNSRGQPYGWIPDKSAPHTSAEPVLWATSALSSLAQWVTRGGDLDLYHKMQFAHAAAALYGPARPTFDGGWNMFPNQRDPERHSTYSSCLAVSALLDTRRADLPWFGGGQPDKGTRDVLINKTAGWLLKTFDFRHAEWYPTPRDHQPQKGLTFQAFATVLRAANESGLLLPQGLVDAVPKQLDTLRRADIRNEGPGTSYDGWIGLPIVNHEGKQVASWAPGFRYLWYPWSIDCATQWLRYIALHPSAAAPRNISRVRRVRDHLIIDQLDVAIAEYSKQPFTFMDAELLYCLDSIPIHPDAKPAHN